MLHYSPRGGSPQRAQDSLCMQRIFIVEGKKELINGSLLNALITQR